MAKPPLNGVAETGVNSFLFLSFSFFSDKRKEHYKKSYFMILRGRTMFDPCLGDADRVYFANRSIPRRRRLAKCPDPVSAHIRPTHVHLIMRACTHCPTHIQIRATPSPVFSFFRPKYTPLRRLYRLRKTQTAHHSLRSGISLRLRRSLLSYR